MIIGSAARFIGIRFADASSGPRMPRALFVLLFATLALFYANNAAYNPLTVALISAKWVPMILLCLSWHLMFRGRRTPPLPKTAAFLLAVLVLISLVGSLAGRDPTHSLFALSSVVVAIVFGYAVSAAVVASNSRRAFFELLGNFSRVMIVLSALFVIASVDLGRGGGFAAWTDNPNTLALILAPGMVVFMAGCIERRPGWLLWHAAFFAVGAYIIWITDARAALAWLGLSAIAFWIYRRGPTAAALGAMVALIILIGWWEPIRDFVVATLGLNRTARDTGISPLSGREEVWRVGWRLFNERYLSGYGFGTSQTLIKAETFRFIQFQGSHFHSSYIETMVETGIFGFLALMSLLGVTVARGVGDATRTRDLPTKDWPLSALPFAMILGAMGHAVFESWLLAAGNANAPVFWSCLFLVFHQGGIPVRAVRRAPGPADNRWNGRRALPAQ